ncbi:MAG: hypothetical protein Q4A07_09495, partial [Coriobacteriales bacterium]|nr:hypothetical protein [Coriobacteriales bacterium]
RVLSFSEQTIREERLAFYFRKRAIAMLFKHFGAMSLRQRIEYLKICLSPLKMRRIILVERAKRENEPKA